nr:cytochrome c oxidase assembly protein [Ruania alba]
MWIPAVPPSWQSYLDLTLHPLPVLPVIGALAGGLYLAGALRLWRADRRWSPWATLSFLSGCAVLVIVMSGNVEGYGTRMFSVFMFQQLTLMMAVPPLLVLGRPGTLLLRATPHHRLGRVVLVGARGALRSGVGAVILHPALMIPLFLLCFYGLYFSDLATMLLRTTQGHIGLELLFLVAGILFTVPILSEDPLPHSHSNLGRAAHLLIEMPTHAFFGVILMMSKYPMVEAFTDPPASWGVDVLDDQQLAGALAWSYGELPGLVMLLILASRWFKDENRQMAKLDQDESSSHELDDYNRYLRSLDAKH